MNRFKRVSLAVVASAGLLASSVTAAVAAPEALPAGSVRPLQMAVKATLAAQQVHFSATVSVNGTRMTATGATNLGDDATAVEVTIGSASSEFRRIGNDYYVNARRLGADGDRWVGTTSVGHGSQMAVRSLAGLIESVSPQQTLQALAAPTTARRVGDDDYGTHYRVAVPQPKATFVPLANSMSLSALSAGPSERVEVWVDAQGRICRFITSARGVRSTFTLHGFGDAVGITAPPSSQTGGLGSDSGIFLFGNGLVLRPPTQPASTVSVAPATTFSDGIVHGTLGATSSAGRALAYDWVSSSNGGKLALGTVFNDPQSYTILPYANWDQSTGAGKGLETFTVWVSENTRVAAYLKSIPLIGALARASIAALQGTPRVSTQLAPTIGAAKAAAIDVHVDTLAPADTPIAFTIKVPGYGGTLISTNFFPAAGLAAGNTAPLVMLGAGLGERGSLNPYEPIGSVTGVPGIGVLRNSLAPGDLGYNVVTWDARGSYDSGGRLQLNNPYFEEVDATRLLDWAAQLPSVVLNGPNDPTVGLIGGSAGGELQLAMAGLDPRIDAIMPTSAWNSMITSLQPNGVLDAHALQELLTTMTGPDVRADAQLLTALQNSLAAGRLTQSARTLLATSNVGPLLAQLQAPTYLIQDVNDAIFPLGEASTTAEAILSNPFGTPVKMAWFDSTQWTDAVAYPLYNGAKLWLDKYVAGVPIPDAAIPTFMWWDQENDNYTSQTLPFESGFNTGTPATATAAGATLTFKDAAAAATTLNVRMSLAEGTQIVGSPTISFTYRGQGTARAVTVTVASAGTAVGRSTGVPVILDGSTRTVSVPLSDFAYTAPAGAQLDFTLSTAPQPFAKAGTGRIRISNIEVDAPVRA